jgi:hypothetical protein
VNGDDVTDRAVELAERILDEVTVYDQDWGNIATWAAELAALARGAAASRGQSPGPGAEGG